jgi:hypothetical protein
MNTTAEALLPESCPAGLNWRLGVTRSRSWVCWICRAASVSALSAVIATGVSCRLSARRRAVTTISCATGSLTDASGGSLCAQAVGAPPIPAATNAATPHVMRTRVCAEKPAMRTSPLARDRYTSRCQAKVA